MPTWDPDDENLPLDDENEDLPDDPELDGGEGEEPDPAPTPPKPAGLGGAPAARKPKKGKKKAGVAGTGSSVPHRRIAVPTEGPTDDATAIWNQLVTAELPKLRAAAYNVKIQILRSDMGRPAVSLGFVDGDHVGGTTNVTPGEMLQSYVEDVYQAGSSSPTPGTYQCVFRWKDGRYITNGKLYLQTPGEIARMRAAKVQREAGMPAQQYPQYPAYPPQHHYPPPPPQGYYPPPGFGAGPASESEAELRAQLAQARRDQAYLQGQLAEVVKAIREGRPPEVKPPPVGVAAPPAAAPPVKPLDLTDIAAVVDHVIERRLGKTGLGGGPAAAAVEKLQSSALAMASGIMDSGIKYAMDGVTRAMRGGGAPQEAPPPEVVEEPTEEPGDKLPVEMVPMEVGGQPITVFGKPAFFPKDRETGGFAGKTFLEKAGNFVMATPGVQEKLIETGLGAVGKIMDGAGGILSKIVGGAVGMGGSSPELPAATGVAQPPRQEEEAPRLHGEVASANGAAAPHEWPKID